MFKEKSKTGMKEMNERKMTSAAQIFQIRILSNYLSLKQSN